jgi:hypothetical protein
VTVDGYVAVAAYVGAVEFSVVKRRRFAHGSQVEPSIPAIGLPLESVAARSVTRCALSASRLMRVMRLSFLPLTRPPTSCPWNRKCVP